MLSDQEKRRHIIGIIEMREESESSLLSNGYQSVNKGITQVYIIYLIT